MEGETDTQMYEWKDKQTGKRMNGQTDRLTKELKEGGRASARAGGRAGGRTDGRTDGRTNRRDKDDKDG